MNQTIAEIADKLGVDKKAARALVQYLLAAGLAELRGTRKPAHGRGKGENVYKIVSDIDVALGEAVRVLCD